MEKIWWNQVTNAVRFVSGIAENLLDEKSIMIKSSSGLPWRKEFEQIIREKVSSKNGNKTFLLAENVNNPGEYILHELCKKEKRAQFRPAVGYARFFAESEDIVLHARYVWVKLSDTQYMEQWLEFVSQYVNLRGDKEKAVFILDWNGEEKSSAKKGICTFSFDDYISEYDRIVFSVLAASEVKTSSFIKNYLAEQTANVVGNDIELAGECIRHYKEFLKNPKEFLEKVCREKNRSDGECFVYDKMAELEHLLWLSQIRTIYPHLEEYREEFVRKYEDQIKVYLPIRSTANDAVFYDDPKEVELGTLKYMADNRQISVSSDAYEKLKKYKDARNKLSHLTVLTFEEIKGLE